jgi:hypothetical protein
VQINDDLGQRVLTLERTVPAGKDLRKGVYVASVITGSGSSVVRFVVP